MTMRLVRGFDSQSKSLEIEESGDCTIMNGQGRSSDD